MTDEQARLTVRVWVIFIAGSLVYTHLFRNCGLFILPFAVCLFPYSLLIFHLYFGIVRMLEKIKGKQND
jgi:hypothetical protein